MGNQTNIRTFVFQTFKGKEQPGQELATGKTDMGKLADAVLDGGFYEISKIIQIDLSAGTMNDISETMAAEICWASRRRLEALDSYLCNFVESFNFRNYFRNIDVAAERSDRSRDLMKAA